ncbi:COP9 signalosome-like protein subunit 6 [Xylaria sp. CBS 124048]|nr:COP9 signalosome-like protein subunit 6 [Xylaria sp. CBS 124048]
MAAVNPLLSAQKASDAGLQAVLHPLVLLTISDYITRHTLRGRSEPIVGALLGQQNGREVTIEHAFECAMKIPPGKSNPMPDDLWFEQRLAQMKNIHSSPQLDLVGWYTLLPKSGPTPAILPIHNWVLSTYNEYSLLLAFHPEESLKHDAGSRLPITIYESNYEADELKNEQGEDKEMRDGEPPLKLRFRELPYSVETGEAEMISVDFVARGAGNATAVEPRNQKKVMPGNADDPKGKRKIDTMDIAESSTDTPDTTEHVLSQDDEEMIAALTAKANAVKMLQSRIKLLIAYLERQPPSRLSDDSNAMVIGESEPTLPSHIALRSIQALVNRLSLMAPSATGPYEQEMLREANDVHLMELLNEVTQSAVELKAIGKKHSIVELSKIQHKKPDDSKSLGSRYAEV